MLPWIETEKFVTTNFSVFLHKEVFLVVCLLRKTIKYAVSSTQFNVNK